ncbi:MAG TPA: hypothetical protein VJ932_09070 [Alkalispirochaeta sp.]|nr:hypothetical protein [Alkalispirochaeta sp.]
MKPWMLGAIGGSVVVLLVLIGIVLFRGEQTSIDDRTGRYTERELLMPGAALRFPSVEEDLLTPQIRSVVDPDEPLSRERVEELKMDSLEALYTDLNPQVEDAVEELLFEE